MAQPDLTETLQGLVRHHGLSSVLHCLANIRAAPDRHSRPLSRKNPTRSAKHKSSAVAYVEKMTLPQEKADVMMRAAQRFKDGGFLPTIADVREFCRIHKIQLGRSTSRASSVPRVFSFLVTMDLAAVTKLLDEGAFSGPTRLAPIADAIRDRSLKRASSHRASFARKVPETTTAGISKSP